VIVLTDLLLVLSKSQLISNLPRIDLTSPTQSPQHTPKPTPLHHDRAPSSLTTLRHSFFPFSPNLSYRRNTEITLDAQLYSSLVAISIVQARRSNCFRRELFLKARPFCTTAYFGYCRLHNFQSYGQESTLLCLTDLAVSCTETIQ